MTDNIALKRYEIYNPAGTRVVNTAISGTSYNVSYEQNAAGKYKIKVYDHLDNVSEQQFDIPGYTVTFKSNNNSYGTVNTTSRTVNFGATASTTITPATGYHYKSVSCTNSQTASHSNGTVGPSPLP